MSNSFSRLLLPVCRMFSVLLLLFAHVAPVIAEEGMYPISELASPALVEKLQKAGLELTAGQVFGDEICQVDGICRVNGCTGSFVSPNGLIITNHHCAYQAIQTSSTSENDLLVNGFHANGLENEIPAKGYTVRITESVSDCSEDVLSVVTDSMTALERTKAIEQQMKVLQNEAEKSNPGLRAEIGEMFVGETYYLFLYTYLKDVRLVFAPPSSVGNFGGEVDNWEWPRHTGDFSFMRAYTAPDGSSAEYAAENVPYQPKKYIQVAPEGVDEGDFVFLLGYPGRTARHNTAAFLTFERDVRLPAVVDLYQWEIATMLSAGESNRAVALKHASRMKGLANVEKRSRGQLKGLRRADLVQARLDSEAELARTIDDPQMVKRYRELLSQIESVYQEMTGEFEYEFSFDHAFSTSRILGIGLAIVDAVHERQKADLDREPEYMDRNFDLTKKRLAIALQDLDIPTDRLMMAEAIRRLSNAPKHDLAMQLQDATNDAITEFVDEVVGSTKVTESSMAMEWLEKSPVQLADSDDSVLSMVLKHYPEFQRLKEVKKERDGKLGQLYGELIEIKKRFARDSFVPDANATLRMTFGYVKGYSPQDAIYKQPITSVAGILEKNTAIEPFDAPTQLLKKIAAGDYGRFYNEKVGSVPVAILYSTDTTGGNSGSPIMNGKGELVGVNFDRAFEATINDFAWNESYSRSIGVDIRYVLWVTGMVFEATDLLKEMGVSLQ